ncbi:hypothetical protein ACMGD3_21900 [Lysinibacillus sphaericus]|uniref:hypothetical protein n=1 Tax=Lysinibacillus sphaericus TaxID=1421 RepID=UPI003F79F84E
MKKNYKLLLQTKEINKYFFKNTSKKLDIYDSQVMKAHLQVEWKELSYKDLKVMEETIEKDINNSNLINSLFGSGISMLIALAVGYVAAYIGIVAADEKINKAGPLIFVSIFIYSLVLVVGFSYIRYLLLNKRNIRLQTIVRVLLDIKKPEQNM